MQFAPGVFRAVKFLRNGIAPAGFCLALTLLLLVPAKSFAGVIYNSSGEITQITNLDVVGRWSTPVPESRFFDVDFLHGTFQDVFGDTALPSDWIMNTASLATQASVTLGHALNAAGIPSTQKFAGGASEIQTPYFAGEITTAARGTCASCVATREVFFWPNPPFTNTGWADSNGTPILSLDVVRTWAIFTDHTEASSPVPAPPTLLLMIAGFFSLLVNHKSIRKN